MGSLFKPKTSVTQAPFESNPWGPQQPYLKTGFEAAGGALTSGQEALSGVTDWTANLNKTQTGALDSLSKSGMGAYAEAGKHLMSQGMSNSGYLDKWGQGAQALYDRASTDRTDEIIQRGGQFADNPHLQGQIDAALGDVHKTFQREVAGINNVASGSGNINSTRAGTLEAYALDDAMDRSAAISSQMRGNAYERGMDRSMAYDRSTTADLMGSTSMFGQVGQNGVNNTATGLGLLSSGAQQAFDAGSAYQNQAQQEIEGAYRGAFAPMDLVNQYMSTVGGSYGQKGFNSQVSKSSSPFQQLVGAASVAAGVM